MKSRLNQLVGEQRHIHVLYAYEELKDYLEKVVDFIHDGVNSGDHVILIENQRISPLIDKELRAFLSDEQMTFIHRVNNFDFYFSSGSYHPPAIVEYFNKTVTPFVEKQIPFRSWAHVEWATMEGPLHIIEDLERVVDQAVNELDFPLICAYDAAQMPDHLQTILLETHPFVLIKNELVVSKEYQPCSD